MKQLPLTVRRSIELLGIGALITLVIAGQSIIMPLLMAFFITLLMLPMFRWQVKHRVPETIAIVLCILAFFLLIAGIAVFLSWQIAGFTSDIRAIQKNLTIPSNNLSAWISSRSHMSVEEQL